MYNIQNKLNDIWWFFVCLQNCRQAQKTVSFRDFWQSKKSKEKKTCRWSIVNWCFIPLGHLLFGKEKKWGGKSTCLAFRMSVSATQRNKTKRKTSQGFAMTIGNECRLGEIWSNCQKIGLWLVWTDGAVYMREEDYDMSEWKLPQGKKGFYRGNAQKTDNAF